MERLKCNLASEESSMLRERGLLIEIDA